MSEFRACLNRKCRNELPRNAGVRDRKEKREKRIRETTDEHELTQIS